MRNDQRYTTVVAALPGTLPPLTREEAKRATRRLVRHFGSPEDAAMRPGFTGIDPVAMPARRSELERIIAHYTDGTGYRRCWVSPKPTASSNSDKGWGRLIHDISHAVHEYRHPGHRPHANGHSKIETDIAAYVASQGWLEGKLRPAAKPRPSLEERRAERLSRLEARLATWERKAKRAQNAVRKLKAKIKAAQRRQS
jgi:hypothetical protein